MEDRIEDRVLSDFMLSTTCWEVPDIQIEILSPSSLRIRLGKPSGADGTFTPHLVSIIISSLNVETQTTLLKNLSTVVGAAYVEQLVQEMKGGDKNGRAEYGTITTNTITESS